MSTYGEPREPTEREWLEGQVDDRGVSDDRETAIRALSADARRHGYFETADALDYLLDALAQLRAERDTLTKALATARAELRPRSNVRVALAIIDKALAFMPDEATA